jgi:hypothetical protein
MANPPSQSSESEPLWPVTFQEVEEAQLKDWLAATPAQRLAMAEELFKFVQLADAARARKASLKGT